MLMSLTINLSQAPLQGRRNVSPRPSAITTIDLLAKARVQDNAKCASLATFLFVSMSEQLQQFQLSYRGILAAHFSESLFRFCCK